jgi:TatD DNase family protein
MLTDAHCHPFDLSSVYPEYEHERKHLGIIAASSSCGIDDYAHNEKLSHSAALAGAAPLLICSGIHPQLPAEKALNGSAYTEVDSDLTIETLFFLAKTAKLAAIGECGFDLYNDSYKETEPLQDNIFAKHLEIVIRFELPVVLHVRRAMHKIFALTKTLSKCKSVIFHSWSGTFEEAQALLRQGVNAWFSFGNTIKLNHKQAMRSCALLPVERLLTETDAPYQPQRGEKFSKWSDLPLILEAAAALRQEAGYNTTTKELENQIEINFRRAFYIRES